MTWLADTVLAATAVELCALILWGRRFGQGISPGNAVSLLLPGAALMLALRLAVSGHGVRAIGLALLLALVAHLHDLYRRANPGRFTSLQPPPGV